jgi:hypothetical protein
MENASSGVHSAINTWRKREAKIRQKEEKFIRSIQETVQKPGILSCNGQQTKTKGQTLYHFLWDLT